MMNIEHPSGQTHHFDRYELGVHRTGIFVLIFPVTKVLGNAFEDVQCLLHAGRLCLQDKVREHLEDGNFHQISTETFHAP